MNGFARRGFVIRKGDEPLAVDPIMKSLKTSYKDLFEAQEHRKRPFPAAKDEEGRNLLMGIHVAMISQDFEPCYDLCAALQEQFGTDWPTVSNGAFCLYMLGDVEAAYQLWQWAATDMEEHRDARSLDRSYMELERPFMDDEWRSVYATIKVNVGEIHWESGRLEMARSDLRDSVQNTTSPAARLPRQMKLAQIELDAGRPAEAQRTAEAAVESAKLVSGDWRNLIEREIGALEDTFTGLRPLFLGLLTEGDEANS